MHGAVEDEVEDASASPLARLEGWSGLTGLTLPHMRRVFYLDDRGTERY